MISRILYRIFLFFIKNPNVIKISALALVAITLLTLISGKTYQNFRDTDPERGAIAMDGLNGNPTGALGEKFSTPVYLTQGWDPADSLWFYNTTQGSALLPYDLFIALEQASSDELVRSAQNMDKYRYLPQKATPFNPDGLPVGFVKDSYSGENKWYQPFKGGKDYVGYTCAACHTGQLNYTKPGDDIATAIRIDGGQAMADMVGFLTDLEAGMKAVSIPGDKQTQFVKNVLARKNDYKTSKAVIEDLKKWQLTISAYNRINSSHVEYGYARLDAFGRIYNRVLRYVISTGQAEALMVNAVNEAGDPILSGAQIITLFKGIEDDVILGDENFSLVISRLAKMNLPPKDMIILRDQIFNEADAPVSYPFLWDIAQSTYVQWNGVANNAGLGPLGRNVGEVIGVFGILDWKAAETTWWKPWTWDLRTSLSAILTGQKNKAKHVTFDSSVNVTNLQRLERKLTSLRSPEWPQDILGTIKTEDVSKGKQVYDRYCIACHEVVQRDDASRLIVSKLLNVDMVGTDPKTAENGVNYSGASGNFEHTYEKIDRVGNVVIEQNAPVIQMLTAAATGVITTPDSDKWFVRRWADWVYNLGASLFENPIKDSVKAGNYLPDTMAAPYNSLLSYKARSLNGIWATAPYLHNGSVPTLYDLLLPSDCSDGAECRPNYFYVGSRAYDPDMVGMKYKGLPQTDGLTLFDTALDGNSNKGHEYSAGKTPQLDGKTILPPLSKLQRQQLLEYLKTL
jgi:cytochrome c5